MTERQHTTQHLQHNNLEPVARNLHTARPFELPQPDALLHCVADSVILTDAAGTILYVNPAFERQSGFPAAEIIGQRLEALLPCLDSDSWQAIQSGQTWRAEPRCTRKDGTTFDADVVVTPICDPDGRLQQVVCVLRDITHLKDVQRLKARFVTEVSNELRDPITLIKMYQSLLERGRPDKREHYRAIIQQELARLEALIENLFSLSQLDLQDAAELERHEVNLNSLVSQIAARFSLIAADQGTILSQDLDYALPPVEANVDLVTQALANLVNNAFAYTPVGGRVTLRTGVMKHAGNLYAAVIVDDTGAGVAPDEQERIFEPFYRGRASQTQVAPGTGLGLSIVHQVARLHGGHVMLRSEGVPGQGSTFMLLLPLPPKGDAKP